MITRAPLITFLFLVACGPGNCIGNCLAVDPPPVVERERLRPPEEDPAPTTAPTRDEPTHIVPTTLASLPLPPGTEEGPSRQGGRSFVVEAELNDTIQFYEEQMREAGWEHAAPPVRMGEHALLQYARGDEKASVALTETNSGRLAGQLSDH